MPLDRIRILVTGEFTAAHLCLEDSPHQHTWCVAAWFATTPKADARLFRASLDELLERWNGGLLPEGRDWNEDIVAQLSMLAGCVEALVYRKADRLGAHWRA